MSTKWNDAVRFPRKHIDDFVIDAIRIETLLVCQRVTKWATRKGLDLPDALDDAEAYAIKKHQLSVEKRRHVVGDWGRFWRVWFRGRYCYALPRLLYTGEEVHDLPYVEPFPYWDNSERPDDMTTRQWGQRGRILEEALSPWWAHVVVRTAAFDGEYPLTMQYVGALLGVYGEGGKDRTMRRMRVTNAHSFL